MLLAGGHHHVVDVAATCGNAASHAAVLALHKKRSGALDATHTSFARKKSKSPHDRQRPNVSVDPASLSPAVCYFGWFALGLASQVIISTNDCRLLQMAFNSSVLPEGSRIVVLFTCEETF
jgi:hypothetical protein